MGGTPAAAAIAFAVALLRVLLTARTLLLLLGGKLESSLEEDSTRRGGGGLIECIDVVGDTAEAGPPLDCPGRGEKLPGGLICGRAGCMAAAGELFASSWIR